MPGLIRYLLILINILLFFNIAHTAEWRISPIRIELNPNDKSSSITVFNEDKIPINFQLKAMEWTQDENGKDIYQETQDIIFFPKLFTLEAGKERLIRIGIKNITLNKEKAYRLFVEEIPSSDKKEGVAVQIALRFGIPIFVKPIKEEILWEITKKSVEKEMFILQLHNKGNIHFNLLNIKITGISKDTPEKEIFTKDIKGWYLLSGVKRTFIEKIDDCNKLSKIKLQIVTDRFSFDDQILLAEKNCNP